MGMIVAADNTKLALAGINIGKLKTIGFSHSRDTKDVTTIDSPGGWREHISGLKGGTSITGTILYTPDMASHLYANGGLLGDMGSWNLLINGSFEAPHGAATIYGWTASGDADTAVASGTYAYDGTVAAYVKDNEAEVVGWTQDYVVAAQTGGRTYYASCWIYCASTSGDSNGCQFTITGSVSGILLTKKATATSSWVRHTGTFTTDGAGETLTIEVGGNGEAWYDAAMLVESSVLTDFHANDTQMQTYKITLPESDGGTCTLSGFARLTNFSAKAAVGDVLEAEFEIITSGSSSFTYNVT